MRYFFEIAYNGRNYAGWQNQANALSVQEVVESAFHKIMGQGLPIVGSGRTDAGVHCRQQFFHCDMEEIQEREKLVLQLNSLLPHDIAINSIVPVKADAHARYSAIERSYEYWITRVKDPFLENFAWRYHKQLDIPTMNQASTLLCEIQDFQCFSKVKTDVNHFLCEMKMASWKEEKNRLIFSITANRFLRGMVRSIVGTLLDLGTEKISLKDFKQIIESKDRRRAGANVPPHGLHLMRVQYPESVFLI